MKFEVYGARFIKPIYAGPDPIDMIHNSKKYEITLPADDRFVRVTSKVGAKLDILVPLANVCYLMFKEVETKKKTKDD